MNVGQLIEALKQFPPDTEVYVDEAPAEGYTMNTERDPFVSLGEKELDRDGRLKL